MVTSLVTGATGFLGGNLARHLLNQGHEVHVLHRRGQVRPALDELASLGAIVHRYNEYDELPGVIARSEPSLVFHLATHYLKDHAAQDVAPLLDANVTFGTHLLESLVDSRATVVATMSYFQFRDGRPHPMSLYSATKQSFMDIGDYYRAGRGLDFRTVVLYDTFGAGDTRDKLVPRLVQAARDGLPVGLGSSHQLIDLLLSDDVSTGLLAAATTPAVDIVALRAQRPTTVGEVVETIGQVTGTPLIATFNEAATTSDLVTASGSWPVPLGWAPAHDLRSGLELTLAG